METFGLGNSSWKYLSSIGDEWVINLQRTLVYVFSDSVLCLGKIHEKTQAKRRANGIRVEYLPRMQHVAAQ